MLINKIDKVGIAQTSLFLLSVVGVFAFAEHGMNKDINNKKNQIMMNDSIKFSQVSKKVQNKPIQVQAEIWGNVYKEMQDSMQKAGIANKNYIEGIQSAKDNLK